MILKNKVVWHEGMFLQPQHFQQETRYLESLIQDKACVISQTGWGFSELALDTELLSLGKIGIAKAKGVLPDGTPFDMPSTDNLPKPFDIPEGTQNTTLYLAIPLRQRDGVEVGEEKQSTLNRYTAKRVNLLDGIDGERESAELDVASLHTVILSEIDDRSRYACLPITQVLEARANNEITLDDQFITTYSDIHALPKLAELITEFHGLLNHRASMLANRLTDSKQAGTAEVVDFMLLQLVNRYELEFFHLMNQRPLHPEIFYKTLIRLMAEMMTYTSNQRRPIQPPAYRHDDLLNTFRPVVQAVRHALTMVLEQNATAIPLQSREHGLWVGEMHDKALLQNSQFILAVYAEMPLDTLRDICLNQLKLAPVEEIATLVRQGLPGVSIAPVGEIPRQIPYHANFAYFYCDTRHALWAQLQKSAGVAIHLSGQLPGLKLELWSIKG